MLGTLDWINSLTVVILCDEMKEIYEMLKNRVENPDEPSDGELKDFIEMEKSKDENFLVLFRTEFYGIFPSASKIDFSRYENLEEGEVSPPIKSSTDETIYIVPASQKLERLSHIHFGEVVFSWDEFIELIPEASEIAWWKLSKRMDSLQLLKNAWNYGIYSDYSCEFITDERSLQAALYFHLRMCTNARNVLFKPTLYNDFRPDIILCDDKEVKIIIEIKKELQHSPEWQKDMEHLIQIHKYIEEDYKKCIHRYLSEYSGYRIHIADSRTLYALCVISHTDAEAINTDLIKEHINLLDESGEFLKRFHLFYGKIDVKSDNQPVFGHESFV